MQVTKRIDTMKNRAKQLKHTTLAAATLLSTALLFGCVSCAKDDDGDPAPDPAPVLEGDVISYTTSANSSRLFMPEAFDYQKVEMSPYRINIDEALTYQSVVGFGPAITGSTCYNLLQMSAEDREAILKQCFDPNEGVGFSFIRVHIGGSDFSLDEYTCQDDPTIPFAIPDVEKEQIFPILKQILAINPAVQILGSPWSCPKWMKGRVEDPSVPFDSWTSGRLNPEYYDEYAQYFVNWVTEMESNGFPIYAITMQNEPLNKGNSMSLYMPWQDQAAFVKELGPAFQASQIDTKILAFDHNYNYDNIADQVDYPLHLYAAPEAAKWLDGSAWHNYGGDVATLDGIYAVAPEKSIYFTEASIGSWNYSFSGSLMYDFKNIFMGTLSRHGKGVLLWNMMLDDKGAPNRPGGCTTCYGAIDISSSDYKTLTFNTHYYNLAHCSKVIKPGAVRVGTNGYTATGLEYLVFKNTDGSMAMVAINDTSEDLNVAVRQSDEVSFTHIVPAKSIISYAWNNQ